jgi:hypothetical protein
MTDFGRGLYLVPADVAESNNKYDWDIDVDETGDLRSTDTGDEELQKDIAFSSATFLRRSIGGPLDPQTFNEITVILRRTFNRDQRIDDIQNLSVSEGDGINEVRINATVIVDNSEQELVFEVSL